MKHFDTTLAIARMQIEEDDPRGIETLRLRYPELDFVFNAFERQAGEVEEAERDAETLEDRIEELENDLAEAEYTRDEHAATLQSLYETLQEASF